MCHHYRINTRLILITGPNQTDYVCLTEQKIEEINTDKHPTIGEIKFVDENPDVISKIASDEFDDIKVQPHIDAIKAASMFQYNSWDEVPENHYDLIFMFQLKNKSRKSKSRRIHKR